MLVVAEPLVEGWRTQFRKNLSAIGDSSLAERMAGCKRLTTKEVSIVDPERVLVIGRSPSCHHASHCMQSTHFIFVQLVRNEVLSLNHILTDSSAFTGAIDTDHVVDAVKSTTLFLK